MRTFQVCGMDFTLVYLQTINVMMSFDLEPNLLEIRTMVSFHFGKYMKTIGQTCQTRDIM